MPEKKQKHKFADFYYTKEDLKDGTIINKNQIGEVRKEFKGKIEEHHDKKSRVGVFAIHGGRIDLHTDKVAKYVADNTQASRYIFKSKGETKGEAEDKSHHVTSTKITPTHSKKLSEIMGHVKTGISIHGHYKKGEHTKKIYVGGDYKNLREQIGKKLQEKLGGHYEVVYDPNNIPRDLKGTSKDRTKSVNNFINKMGDYGGVQIELPEELREKEEHRKLVGDTLVEIINGPSPDTKKQKNPKYKRHQQYQDKAAA